MLEGVKPQVTEKKKKEEEEERGGGGGGDRNTHNSTRHTHITGSGANGEESDKGSHGRGLERWLCS